MLVLVLVVRLARVHVIFRARKGRTRMRPKLRLPTLGHGFRFTGLDDESASWHASGKSLRFLSPGPQPGSAASALVIELLRAAPSRNLK